MSPGPPPRNHHSLRQTPAAGGAEAGGAAVAVVPQADGPGGQGGQIEVLNGLGQARKQGQVQGLVEVAVVEAPVPGDADEAAAHEAGHRGRVKTGHQLAHVTLIIPGPLQKLLEAPDGHVEQGQELVEVNTVAVRQLPAEEFFQGALLRRQVGARGVVHEIKPEVRARFAVADAIEAAQGFQALLKHPGPRRRSTRSSW